MRFHPLTEADMLREALCGKHVYVDLLLSKHEDFLLQRIELKTNVLREQLDLRQKCIQHVRESFSTTFDVKTHLNFADWLAECVEAVLRE